MNREFYTRTLLTEDGRVIRLREPALVRIADPNERRGRLRMKDGRVIEISGEQLLFLLSNPFEEIGRFEIRWRLKKNRGPQSNYIQDRIEERLAALPPGLKVAVKAEILRCSESTIHRLLRRLKKS